MLELMTIGTQGPSASKTLALIQASVGMIEQISGGAVSPRGTASVSTDSSWWPSVGSKVFDLTNGGLIVKDTPNFSEADTYTIEFWVLGTNTRRAFLSKGGALASYFNLSAARTWTLVSQDQDKRTWVGYATFDWQHIAITSSPAGSDVFLGGTKRYTSPKPLAWGSPDNDLIVGFDPTATLYGNSKFDQIRISNVVRYTADFTPEYNKPFVID